VLLGDRDRGEGLDFLLVCGRRTRVFKLIEKLKEKRERLGAPGEGWSPPHSSEKPGLRTTKHQLCEMHSEPAGSLLLLLPACLAQCASGPSKRDTIAFGPSPWAHSSGRVRPQWAWVQPQEGGHPLREEGENGMQPSGQFFFSPHGTGT
jgi:hypothetical protein